MVVEPDVMQQISDRMKNTDLPVNENGHSIVKKGKGIEKKILGWYISNILLKIMILFIYISERVMWKQFLDCLIMDTSISESCYKLVKQRHTIFFSKCQKKILNSYDNKRKLKSCGIHTAAHGQDMQNTLCYCDRRG